MPPEDWSDELAAVLLGVARGDFEARMKRTGERDQRDAIAFLVNATVLEVERLFHELEDANLRLRHTQAQLVRAAKLTALGQLSGAVAHELNNPLMGLGLHLELLAQDVAGLPIEQGQCDELLGHVDRIRSGKTRCAQVVSALLAFGQQGVGEARVIDLRDTINTTLRLLSHKLHLGGVSVTRDLPDHDLPVLTTGNQLGQVVLDLVLNAADSMPDGGEIVIQAAKDAGEITMTVRDTGPGIPVDVQERMFEPFFTTKSLGEGAGLGLSVGHGIAESHGGRIEVDSAPGRGTAIKLILPEDR